MSQLSGFIDEGELYRAFKDMGVQIDKKTLHDMILEVDEDSNGEIDFFEFSVMLFKITNKMLDVKSSEIIEDEEEQLSWWEENFPEAMEWRAYIWDTFEEPETSDFAQGLTFVLIALIVVSCVAFVVEHDPYILRNPHWEPLLLQLETGCVIVFTIEYVMRLACCPSVYDFLTGFMNTIDLVAILPFYLGGCTILALSRLYCVCAYLLPYRRLLP